VSIAAPPHVLIVKTGTTNPAVVARHGDYDDWFARELGRGGARWTVVDAYTGGPVPDPTGFDGVILTGSPLSVRDDAAWMPRLGAWALSAAADVPVLAVCFGHQIVGEALGGRIEPNPAGGEYGTIEVDLTAAGQAHPLYAGMPARISVQSTHRDVLLGAPTDPATTLLGSTGNTRWQTFSWGPRLHAVQFHPELQAPALAQLMASRGIAGETRPAPDGPQILANWLAFVRAEAAPPPA
jgi:GMP synthase (glutamine-hydrolysing)